MTVEIFPSKAKGKLIAPPSKSVAHRALIAAALCDGKSLIENIAFSEDICATLDCLSSLGIGVLRGEQSVSVQGGSFSGVQSLECRESGSTLRFMLPLCLLDGKERKLCGSERLLSRPLSVYEELCAAKGFLFRSTADGIYVAGKLSCGEYTIPADVSSQFVSGLIFALLCVEGESLITLSGNIESGSYIDLTISILREFGFKVRRESERAIVICGGRGQAREFTLEGDQSNAAFFAALGALGGEVELSGLSPDSLQGDRVYSEYFAALQSGYSEISLADCPDLGPILFVLAAALHGGTFHHIERLRFKESDRIAAMSEELAKFGVEMQIQGNSVIVPAAMLQRPQQVLCGHNDHRIVMALAVLCTLTGGTIEGEQAVHKSLPDFFERLLALGIDVR